MRYAVMGSIQLGPSSIVSTSMSSGLETLGSGRYSILIPWRSVSEDEARRANWSAYVFSSREI